MHLPSESFSTPKIKLCPTSNPHGIVPSGPDSLYDVIEQMVSSAGMIRPAFLTAHEQIAANYGHVLALFYVVQIVRNKIVADSPSTNDVISLNELSRDYAARAKGLHTALVSLYGLVDVDLVALSDDVAEAAEHIATERAEWLFKKPGFSISDL